jgi:hypothetical protein
VLLRHSERSECNWYNITFGSCKQCRGLQRRGSIRENGCEERVLACAAGQMAGLDE